MKFLLLVFFLSACAWAQHTDQPAAESNQDLRSNSILFSISDVKKNTSYTLQRTAALDHLLIREEGKDKSVQKIDSREAKKLDSDFGSRFLRCQYELTTAPGECEVTLRLNLKGETQDLCQKDENKTREFVSVIDDLKKRF